MTTTPPPPATRLGIAIDLDSLRQLMREFIDEVAGADADLKVTMEWTMEAWLQWLRKKREAGTNNQQHLNV